MYGHTKRVMSSSRRSGHWIKQHSDIGWVTTSIQFVCRSSSASCELDKDGKIFHFSCFNRVKKNASKTSRVKTYVGTFHWGWMTVFVTYIFWCECIRIHPMNGWVDAFWCFLYLYHASAKWGESEWKQGVIDSRAMVVKAFLSNGLCVRSLRSS